MRAFRDQPLARKALFLGVVPALCAVLVLTAMSITATFFRVRRNIGVDLAAQAAIVSESVASALDFGDPATATATVEAVGARRNVSAVCVFDLSGQLFASYAKPGRSCEPSFDTPPPTDQGLIVRERTIVSRSRTVGTVRVEGSLIFFYEWVGVQVPAILGALVISGLIAFVLTRFLKRVISDPVLDLARTADAVSVSRDYSRRAVQITNDEVGGLVQSFNNMLEEIQRQNELLTSEIAERKRAEQLRDTFLAAVSHELRTPLNAILGRLQLLRATNPTGPQLERALDSLERNARSQARLVEDLLDVSRITSGKFQMRFDVVDLRAVVSAALDSVTSQAAAKSIHLTSTIPTTPCLVSGDSDRLGQAIGNVLSNAVKFTEGGVIAVDISTVRGTQEYCIGVQDSGVGIAPEFLPRVFERFRQADDSMTRQHSGLGLGLAIVKEVVELHGGSVVAASAGTGRGSRFTIRLPQLIGNEAAVTTVPLSSPALTPLLRGLHVLVVDDEPDGLDIAATALRTAGALVVVALSGQVAVEKWCRGSFDVLVCDLGMPGMDGFQVLDQIMNFDQARGRRPIALALTAYASNDYRHRSLAAGFDAHLAKPYNTSDLVTAVADAAKNGKAANRSRAGNVIPHSRAWRHADGEAARAGDGPAAAVSPKPL